MTAAGADQRECACRVARPRSRKRTSTLTCAPWRVAQKPLLCAETFPAHACAGVSVGGARQKTPVSGVGKHRPANCRSTPTCAQMPPSRKRAETPGALVCVKANVAGADPRTPASRAAKHRPASLLSTPNRAPLLATNLQQHQICARASCVAGCARANAVGAKVPTAAYAAGKPQSAKLASMPNSVRRQELPRRRARLIPQSWSRISSSKSATASNVLTSALAPVAGPPAACLANLEPTRRSQSSVLGSASMEGLPC